MQGMGWTCIEELQWGDKQHPWIRPGQLFTRGPGTYKVGPSTRVVGIYIHLCSCTPLHLNQRCAPHLLYHPAAGVHD